MARPVKIRTSYDREIGLLVRLRRVVQADSKGTCLWHVSVEERISELLTLFMSEDTRRRKARS